MNGRSAALIGPGVAAEQRSREAAVADMRAELAQQMRAAYMIGREEP